MRVSKIIDPLAHLKNCYLNHIKILRRSDRVNDCCSTPSWGALLSTDHQWPSVRGRAFHHGTAPALTHRPRDDRTPSRRTSARQRRQVIHRKAVRGICCTRMQLDQVNAFSFAGLFFQHFRVNSSLRKTHFLAFGTKLKTILAQIANVGQLSLYKNCGKKLIKLKINSVFALKTQHGAAFGCKCLPHNCWKNKPGLQSPAFSAFVFQLKICRVQSKIHLKLQQVFLIFYPKHRLNFYSEIFNFRIYFGKTLSLANH